MREYMHRLSPDDAQQLRNILERYEVARKVGDDEDGPNWYLHDVGLLLTLLQKSYQECDGLAREFGHLRRTLAMSPGQRRIYETIASLESELGYAPTLRQIAERAGLRSTSTVHAHLQRLLQAGVIRRASRTVGYTTRGQAS